MEKKDILTLVASGIAILVSLISFYFSFRQRSIEDRRATRKALTDVVAELTKVNIAFAQLAIDYSNSTDERVVAFRRNYNDQRRYLANHGEFLSDQIPELTTDIDCMVIGSAFASHGDYVRAEKFHKMAVDKSPNNVIRMNNLRALASFYFRRGNAPLGRKTYEEALQLEVPNDDSIRQFTADTYMLWAKRELDSGYENESRRLQVLAKDAAKLIGQKLMREDMFKQIDASFSKSG
jgi:hypothetical protein